MNITVLSAFRNAVPQIDRYFAQVEALDRLLVRRGDWLSLTLTYGDSHDGTGESLFEAAAQSIGAHLVEFNHGGPHYGSVEDPHRFRQLAQMANHLWSHLPTDANIAILVESDLIWEPETLVAMIDHLAHVPAVAPMILDGPDSFYDVFAYRRNGVRFTKQPPFHADLVGLAPGQLLQVDSAGSLLAIRGNLARQVRFTETEVVVGLCKKIYAQGGSVWVDPSLCVNHP